MLQKLGRWNFHIFTCNQQTSSSLGTHDASAERTCTNRLWLLPSKQKEGVLVQTEMDLCHTPQRKDRKKNSGCWGKRTNSSLLPKAGKKPRCGYSQHFLRSCSTPRSRVVTIDSFFSGSCAKGKALSRVKWSCFQNGTVSRTSRLVVGYRFCRRIGLAVTTMRCSQPLSWWATSGQRKLQKGLHLGIRMWAIPLGLDLKVLIAARCFGLLLGTIQKWWPWVNKTCVVLESAQTWSRNGDLRQKLVDCVLHSKKACRTSFRQAFSYFSYL